MDGVIGDDLLKHLAAADRLNSDHDHELGALGEAVAPRWGPN
jgi:hypothetical protein